MKAHTILSLSLGLLLAGGCASERYSATSDREDLPARGRGDRVSFEQATASELAAIDSFQLYSAALVNPTASAVALAKSATDIPAEYQNNVIQIRSERSTAGLQPTEWHIVYADKSGQGQPMEVRFADGEPVESSRSLNAPTPVSESQEVFDLNRVKIDSPEAVERAIQASERGKDLIDSTALRLEMHEGAPVWKVKLWAEGGSEGAREIGEVVVNAETGNIVSKTEPEREEIKSE